MQACEQTKRLREKRYGKRAIKDAIQEMNTVDWVEKYARACPYCSMQIQVFVTSIEHVLFFILMFKMVWSESSICCSCSLGCVLGFFA